MTKPQTINALSQSNSHERNLYVLRHLNRLVTLAEMNKQEDLKLTLLMNSIDNLLALGNITKAVKLIDMIDSTYQLESLSIKALFYHAKGLIKLYQAHVIEALEAFDDSMAISKEIKDDHLFHQTRLYKEIALIQFYEPEAINHLATYLINKDYLSISEATMISAHFLMGSIFLNKPIIPEILEMIEQLIQSDGTGPYVLYLMAKSLNDKTNVENEQSIHVKIQSLLLKTQGIKGGYWIINHYIKDLVSTQSLDEVLLKWTNAYIQPITAYLKADQEGLFNHLEDDPKVSITSCLNCDNRCCYDGVYVTYEEEKNIKEHILLYPNEFTHVPTEFLEDGEWEFLFGGKRTKRVPHHYSRSDYPSHFEKTICIFALEDGSCSLQKSAIKHDMHPWRLKPELCWKFPLIGLFNDNGYEHPHYFGEKDPHYFDESQPGYLSFLPCSVVTIEGISWKQMYRNELQYYLAKESKKKK